MSIKLAEKKRVILKILNLHSRTKAYPNSGLADLNLGNFFYDKCRLQSYSRLYWKIPAPCWFKNYS